MEIFALIVLIVLVASVLAVRAMLGMYPGKIARERKHPQAEAISHVHKGQEICICGPGDHDLV
jgi:hypothetical protein